jgi:outer membrane protein TolC
MRTGSEKASSMLYRTGSTLVVELIDTQNTAFGATTAAVIAHYTYLRDLVEL